jgi:hypothetical protein
MKLTKKGVWQLEEHDAAIIKGMLNRGDKQHDIAAFFGVNGGRIAEIRCEYKFADVPAVGTNDLPPSIIVGSLTALLKRAVAVSGEREVRQALEMLTNG